MLTAALIALAFLLGSIPFGLIIGKARGIDIRQHGSRNIGATNVGRVLGRRWGFLCFALDFAKGFAPTLFSSWLLGTLGTLEAPRNAVWSGLAVMAAAIFGHMFSPWVGFKGGKGVATGFGALAAIWPALGVPVILAFVAWAAVLASTRYMGLASCIAAAILPVGVWFAPAAASWIGWLSREGAARADVFPHLCVSTLLAGFVIWKHRGNIRRMIEGRELRLGGSGAAPPASN
ncbi:MAG: glycerol-3-phosphate 1-O-acyltransferase PlsY [Phycisphaerales bacterium]